MRIFEPEDVLSLLRSEIERVGDQGAWARKAGLDQTALNKILNGRKPLTPSIIRALGLRIAIVSDDRRQKKLRRKPGVVQRTILSDQLRRSAKRG